MEVDRYAFGHYRRYDSFALQAGPFQATKNELLDFCIPNASHTEGYHSIRAKNRFRLQKSCRNRTENRKQKTKLHWHTSHSVPPSLSEGRQRKGCPYPMVKTSPLPCFRLHGLPWKACFRLHGLAWKAQFLFGATIIATWPRHVGYCSNTHKPMEVTTSCTYTSTLHFLQHYISCIYVGSKTLYTNYFLDFLELLCDDDSIQSKIPSSTTFFLSKAFRNRLRR